MNLVEALEEIGGSLDWLKSRIDDVGLAAAKVEIKKLHRTWMRTNHPDVGGDAKTVAQLNAQLDALYTATEVNIKPKRTRKPTRPRRRKSKPFGGFGDTGSPFE